MKKLLLTLGSAASIAAPLATVVACGEEAEVNYLQIDGKDFVPTEDGVYLMDEHYTGTVTKLDGTASTGIVELVDNHYTAGTAGIVELDKNDSIVVVYDKDNSDGFSLANFESTFAFSDSSTAYSSTLAEYNVSAYDNVLVSSEWGDSTAVYTTFANGFSNRYIGSTFGFAGLEDSLKASKATLSEADYNALLDTYKYEDDGTGALTDRSDYDASVGDTTTDPVIPDGEDRWLRGGAVILPQTGTSMFSYEKIADNAMKVTYLFDNASFDNNSGGFGFITESDVAGEYTMDKKGTLSLGANSWNAYDNASDFEGNPITHSYQGKKA